MLRLSSLVSLFLLLASFNPSLVSASRLSSPAALHRLLSSGRFSTLTAPSPSSICSPTYGCLPEGFPVPDPATVHFIQFPNGVSVNLQGYGAVSLPQGYPVAALPSYDASSNTIKDPFFATVLAYALSTAANPNFNGVWGGWTLPGEGTGAGGGGNGEGGVSTGGSVINENESSTGVSGNGNGNGNSNTATATATTGGISHGGATSSTGGGGTSGNNGSGSNTNNNNNNNNNGGSSSKNGASALVGSMGLVAGLAMAAIFASLF